MPHGPSAASFPLWGLLALACACDASVESTISEGQPLSAAVTGPGNAVDLVPETDLPPTASGRWDLAGGASLVLQSGGRLSIWQNGQERLLSSTVVGRPTLDERATTLAWAQRDGTGPGTRLLCVRQSGTGWTSPRNLLPDHLGGSPDRPSLSPDGRWLVFTWGITGLASLWLLDMDSGDHRQLTNVGLENQRHVPGSPPAGFVPVPHHSAPVFSPAPGRPESSRNQAHLSPSWSIAWDAPDGHHELELE